MDLFNEAWRLFMFRWLHVISGVMWIGLLWYLNFVQTPAMPKIPDEQKPAVSKFIAPRVLFWFRWAALSTVVTGLILGDEINHGASPAQMPSDRSCPARFGRHARPESSPSPDSSAARSCRSGTAIDSQPR